MIIYQILGSWAFMKLDHELGEDEEKLDHGRGRGAGIPTKDQIQVLDHDSGWGSSRS